MLVCAIKKHRYKFTLVLLNINSNIHVPQHTTSVKVLFLDEGRYVKWKLTLQQFRDDVHHLFGGNYSTGS